MKKAIVPQGKNPISSLTKNGYDPEMLFVECGKCGSPIVWEQGRATEILHSAGIDALELDPHCLLVTDGCPRCSKGKMYHVQIFRVEADNAYWSSARKKAGHA